MRGYHGSTLERDNNIIYVESYKDGKKVTKFVKAVCAYVRFAKVLIFDKPDLVHIHSSFGPSFYRKIPFIYMASWAGKPIVNHIHGADFDEFYIKASDAKKRLIKKVYNKCTVLIALSAQWKEWLSQIVSENKIAVVENYSVLHEDSVNEKISRESNNNILFLGEIGKRKGCLDIPEVVEKVVEEIPNVTFVIAGSGRPTDEQTIRKLTEKYKVSDHVEYPGWVIGKQKDALLRKADIFFLPSYNEGMPMSILDAMGYGLPIVSTKVGGIDKCVINNKNGFLYEAGDKDGFATAIISILSDENKRRAMSKESYQIAKSNYSLESHIRKIEDIYNTILSDRNRDGGKI